MPASELRALDHARAADRMVELLTARSVDTIFGLPGKAIAPIHDALLDHPRIRTVTMRHESNAVFAACGYAFATGKPGIVAVTSGPGILNCMTSIAAARCDGIPIVVLAGEAPRSRRGKGALQDGDALGIREILGPVAKWVAEIPDAGAAVPMLDRALNMSLGSPPGPVVLLLPDDLLVAPARAMFIDGPMPPCPRIPRHLVGAVRAALCASDRGVILAGAGVRADGGARALRQLAERITWPVITTPKGKGLFPESHPLSLGVFGMGGHPSAHRYLRGGIDTMLAVGTSLGELATDGWSALLRPSKALIHIDIDATHIGRSYPADIAAVAPAGAFLRALTRSMKRQATLRPRPPGIDHHTDPRHSGNGPEGRIAPARAIWELQQNLPADTIYAVDSGSHTLVANHYLRIERADSYLAMLGLGAMSASISAIGVKMALPHRPVAAICGDGGFAMLASELATAVRHALGIVFFVFNDRALGMVEQGNTHAYGRTPRYSTEPLDIPMLARALGARSAVAERANDILAMGRQAFLGNVPLVVDVRIDRKVLPPQTARFDACAGEHEERLPADMPANELFESLRDLAVDPVTREGVR